MRHRTARGALSLVKFCVSHALLWRWHAIDIARTGSLHRMAGAYTICVHKLTLYVSFKGVLVPSGVWASRTELSTWLPLVLPEILSFSSILAILSWFSSFPLSKNTHLTYLHELTRNNIFRGSFRLLRITRSCHRLFSSRNNGISSSNYNT